MNEYIALFPTKSAAIAFEQRVLGIGREFLPPAALAVLDGAEPTEAYWHFLIAQARCVTPDPMNPDERAALHARHPELAALEQVMSALDSLETPGARARALLQVTLKLAPNSLTEQQYLNLMKMAKLP